MFDDLREFLQRAQELGQCKVIEGSDWDLEISQITQLQQSVPDAPLLLFDKIKGHKPGYRVVTNFLNTPKLVALAFGLPLESRGIEQVRAWRDKIKEEFKPIPPMTVKSGPVRENIQTGKNIDLLQFPAPKWNKLDGGRYIGTGCIVIQRDPDDGGVNLGTYRVQVHDKTTATIYMAPGRHGNVVRRKYWDRGLGCPAAIVCGQEPLLLSVSFTPIPRGICEYDYTGWLRNKPIEVVSGEATDLPIPAGAELVLEGEMLPPGTETRKEGPFGEYTGYYASGARTEPAFKVKAILHRNDPIITGAPMFRGTYYYEFGKGIISAAHIWNALDKQVPGVKGVWIPTEATGPSMVIISLEQKYGGHAKQAAMFAAGYYVNAHMCRFIIVVDDDIDPSNKSDVYWALGTRCDPANSIDIMRSCWGTELNPMLSPEARSRGDLTISKAIITACKPYYWMKDFPPAVRSSPEELEKTKQKWGKLLFD